MADVHSPFRVALPIEEPLLSWLAEHQENFSDRGACVFVYPGRHRGDPSAGGFIAEVEDPLRRARIVKHLKDYVRKLMAAWQKIPTDGREEWCPYRKSAMAGGFGFRGSLSSSPGTETFVVESLAIESSWHARRVVICRCPASRWFAFRCPHQVELTSAIGRFALTTSSVG